MPINMNGNDNDPAYRYKIPDFVVQIAGQGNGIFTMFRNIDDISKNMNHPKEVLLKYFASVTGSNYNPSKDSITGTHKPDDLKKIILQYIKYIVMCPSCNIPETIPKVVGNKKNPDLQLTCCACKNESLVKPQNKQITKGIDIIIKYLNGGGEWVINKGWMVLLNQSERAERKKARALNAAKKPDSNTETPDDDNVTTTKKYQANPFDALDVNSPSDEDSNSSADSSDIDIDAI